MQNICRILQLTDISIMAVERDKSRREGILLRMSIRESVPLKCFQLVLHTFGFVLLVPEPESLGSIDCSA